MATSKETNKKDFFDKLSSLSGVFIAIAGFCATYIYNENQIKIQKEKTISEIQAAKVEILENSMKYVISDIPEEREFGYTVFATTGFEDLAIKLIAVKNDKAGVQVLKNIASDTESKNQMNAKTILQKLSSNPVERIKQVVNYFETGDINKSITEIDKTIIDTIYYSQTIKMANELGIISILGMASLYDTYVNNGPVFTNKAINFATTKLNGSPKTGIKETDWLREFLEFRYKWYLNSRNELIRKGSFRPKFFIDQLNSNNINLDNL